MMRFIYTVKSDLGTVTKKCLLCSIEIYSRLRRYSEYTYDLVDQLIVALKRIIFLVPDASNYIIIRLMNEVSILVMPLTSLTVGIL